MNHMQRSQNPDTLQKSLRKPHQNNQHHRSNVNLSQSVCSFVSAGGKHLRKSMNDIFSTTATKLSAAVEDLPPPIVPKRDDEPQETKENKNKVGYAKRIKRTLIKTKNSLFNRGNKPTVTTNQNATTIENPNSQALKRKSTSSPSLAKLNLTTGAATRFELELDANQSFVNSFRSRFIKRSRSSKLNVNNPSFIQNNLNSTTITAKLSNTVIGPTSSTTAPKRPKFY